MAHILIAEDDSALRTLLQKGLTRKGHTIVVSPDGKEAFERLSQNCDYDLIITDMMMPHMDGRELIETIRKSKKLQHLPIIIMSGVVRIKEISDLLKNGASAFIAKPIRMADLDKEIKEMVGLPSKYILAGANNSA